jgi:hypothetical protein
MSYIGRQNLGGAYRQLDDISSGFDGSDTTHTMQVNSTNVTVGDVNQILLSLGGVIQKPGTDFTVSGSTLTFTTAPAANTSFFAILLGSDNGGTVTPTDGSVTGDKIANNLAIATNVSISTADNTDTLTLKSTDADASVGPVLTLHRESSSPADDDIIGRINFIGEDSGGTDTTYGRIETVIMQESNGSEDATMEFRIMKGGTERNVLELDRTAVIINEDSQDVDFRVESNGLTHALFVDAGNDIVRVGLGSGGDVATSGFQVGDTKNNVFAAHIFHTGDNSSAAPKGLQITYTASSPDTSTSAFFRCNDSTTDRMFITSEGDIKNHDNSYGSTSDERIKQDIRDSNSQWDDIKNIKIRNYKKKDDVRQYGDKAWEQIGVIAQELETVSPKLIRHNDPSASDILSDSSFGTIYEDGDSIPEDKKIGDVKEIKEQVKSVSYSVLYMKAIKALQEAMAKIETLETKVKALEDA